MNGKVRSLVAGKFTTRTAAALAVAQVFMMSSAWAQDNGARHAYSLPAAPLEATLLKIAQEAGQNISFDSATVSALKSAPVKGEFTTAEAIDHALAGSGLERQTTPSGAFAIKPKAGKAAAAATAGAATAAAASTTGVDKTTTDSSDISQLPIISVAAQRDSGGNGYVATSSSTLTRTDTPLSATPNSISVVNAAVIQSQADQSLVDILRNVAGVTARPGPLGVPTFAVRGFAGATILTDGMQTSANSELTSSSLTPSIAISSVEVLKGPAAILAGDAPAGGVINIVKKTPQADPFHEVQFSYGTFGDVTASLDSTGAITKDNKLMYRFILSDEQAGQNSGGYDGKRNFYFAPTLEWKDRSTDLTVGYSRSVTSNPVPAYTIGRSTGGFVTEGFDHPLGNPSDGFTGRQDDVFYKLEQKLGDHITFVSRADYVDSQQLQRAWTPVTLLSGNSGVFMGFDTSENVYNLSLENYVRAKYDFGPVKTTTLVGWDYQQSHYNEFEWNDGGQIAVIPNVYAPGSFPALTSDASGLAGVVRGTVTVSGLFLQEQVNYGRFHVLGSIRNSEFWEANTTQSIYNSIDTTNVGRGWHQNAWTPNIGVMFDVSDDVSAFANYMRGFQPNAATTYTGAYLAPESSQQAEVGVKGNFLDDKLSVTASAYRISYDNQNIADPVHAGYYIPVGGAVSRGFELEIAGQIAKGLNVIGNYTYNDYVQAYSPGTKVNLPHNSASLWTTYNFQTEKLQGLGVGLGLYYSDGQEVGSTANYRIPSQLETDVGVFYRKKKFGLNLSVKNVFNRNLYYSSTSSDFIPMGPTRTVLLTGTYDF